ncbi:MAG: hypothetical protein ABIO79_15195 [Ferruginibacter sp.]
MNINKFLPSESYTLTTKLSVDQVRARIQDITGPKLDLGFFTSPKNNSLKPYEGSISGNSFNISRVINYGNSFLPVITGAISSYAGRTDVKIDMRLAAFVRIFVLIFLGLIGFSIIIHIFLFARNLPAKSSFSLLISFIAFIFCVLLTYFAFKKESTISKQFLAKLLEEE